MAKFENNSSLRDIALNQIKITGNIRKGYSEIDELAASIKQNGLMQPICLKLIGKDENGIDSYELISGHRRYLAFKYLCEKGDNFNSIKSNIIAGDKLILQITENIQRMDLDPLERESAINTLRESGLSIEAISQRIGKNESYVKRNLYAYEMRKIANEKGISTDTISTQALNEIHAVDKKDIPRIIHKLKLSDGSMRSSRDLMNEYRDKKNGISEKSDMPQEKELCQSTNSKTKEKQSQDVYKEIYDVPHKQCDINSVFLIINDYIKKQKVDNELTERAEGAFDILALLHQAIEDKTL